MHVHSIRAYWKVAHKSMKPIYREYQKGDLEQLKNLMAELGYSVELIDLENNINTIHKNGGEIFIAENHNNVIGSVCVLLDARLAEGIYAEVVSLIVSENDRRKGIGKVLVEKAENWARKRVNKIRVRANEIRESTHSFYISQGYKEIKTQKVFIKRI